MSARRAIKTDLSSLSSEPLLGSASASLHAFWPAVMRQYSMQVANPFLFLGQRGHDDAIRGRDAESIQFVGLLGCDARLLALVSITRG